MQSFVGRQAQTFIVNFIVIDGLPTSVCTLGVWGITLEHG
jgi:hypothetical protein